MSLFSNKKALLARYLLSKKVDKRVRHKEFHNLDSAQRVGILFQSHEPKDQLMVKEFVNRLKKYNIQAEVLGWIDSDTFPDYSIGQQILYFCRKDVNWWGKPLNAEVDNFIQTKFDILFDLSPQNNHALCYVSHLSRAACKVGPYGADHFHLDLMLNTGDPFSIKQLMEQSISYLTSIKKTN